MLVYTNVLTYFLRQSLDFLGIPKENVRTFDDWCADLWDKYVRKSRPRTVPDRRGKSFIDFPAVRVGVLHSLQTLADAGQLKPSLDFVLVDEGQDLDATAYGILRLTTKHLTIFADARQQIFEGGASVSEMQQHLTLTGQGGAGMKLRLIVRASWTLAPRRLTNRTLKLRGWTLPTFEPARSSWPESVLRCPMRG